MTVNTKTDTTQPPKHLVNSFKNIPWRQGSHGHPIPLFNPRNDSRRRAKKKTIPNMSGLVAPSTSLLSLQLKFHTTQSRHETARSKTKENPKGVRGIQSAIESYSSNRNLSLVTKTRRGLSRQSRPVKEGKRGQAGWKGLRVREFYQFRVGQNTIATSSTLKPRHVSRLSSPRHIRFTQRGLATRFCVSSRTGKARKRTAPDVILSDCGGR